MQAGVTTTELRLQLPGYARNTLTLSLDGVSRSQLSAGWFSVPST